MAPVQYHRTNALHLESERQHTIEALDSQHVLHTTDCLEANHTYVGCLPDDTMPGQESICRCSRLQLLYDLC